MEPGDDEAETRGARRRQARKGNGGVAGGAPPPSCGLCRGPRPRNRATAERRFSPDRSDVGAVHVGRSRLRERSEGPEWSGLVDGRPRLEAHTSELESLMRTSYAAFCLQKKTNVTQQ